MPVNEARLYFVVTVKGDLGPFSKQELREQLREQAFTPGDRVRNAFGRPLGSVGEVLGTSSQLAMPAGPAAAPPPVRRQPQHQHQHQHSGGGPPWPIIAAAAVVVGIIAVLAFGGGAAPPPPPPPPETPQTSPAAAPARQTPPPTASIVSAQPKQPTATPPEDSLPAGFAYIDLGDARPRGSATAKPDGVIIVNGGGSDIWGESDECGFVHRALRGDAALTVQLRSMDDTDSWDKAGLMLRSSLEPAGPHASILAGHGGLVQFAFRGAAGASTGENHIQMPGLPIWLRLVRTGRLIVGAASRDGRSWTDVGSVTLEPLGEQATAGLAVCSHNRSTTNRAQFSDLQISAPPPATQARTAISDGTIPVQLAVNVSRTWDQLKSARFAYGPKQAFDPGSGETRIWLPYGDDSTLYHDVAGVLTNPGSSPENGRACLTNRDDDSTTCSLAYRLVFDRPVAAFRFEAAVQELNLGAGSVAGVEYSLDGAKWTVIDEKKGTDPGMGKGMVLGGGFGTGKTVKGLRTQQLFVRIYARDARDPQARHGDKRWLRLIMAGDPGWGDAATTFFACQPQLWVAEAAR